MVIARIWSAALAAARSINIVRFRAGATTAGRANASGSILKRGRLIHGWLRLIDRLAWEHRRRSQRSGRLSMAESLTTKSSKGESAEQAQKAPRELVRQPMSGSLYGNMLSLQRSAGNRAVTQLIGLMSNSTPSGRMSVQRKCASCAVANGECAECKKRNKAIQTKLTISKPGDKYEQEADRIADEIMVR